jgi:hypothetical protein
MTMISGKSFVYSGHLPLVKIVKSELSIKQPPPEYFQKGYRKVGKAGSLAPFSRS